MRRYFWSMAKFLLFRLDPERAHGLMVAMVRAGIRLRMVPLRIASGASGNPSGGAHAEVLGLCDSG